MNESSCVSISLLTFGVARVPDFGHSNRYVVICHCLNLHSPDDIWYGSSSHMLICHLCMLFGQVSIKLFGLFF